MVQPISFLDENVEPDIGLPGETPSESGEPSVGSELAGGTAAVLARWYRLRNGCHFPAWSDLEQCLLATNGPDSPGSIVIGYRGKNGALKLETRRVRESSLSIPEAGTDLSSKVLQWVRAVAGEAVRIGRPLADTEAFPSSTGQHRYHALALPFTRRQTDCYRVHCQLHRVT